MIGRVAFASCYVYSPAGESALCARSRLLRALLKDGALLPAPVNAVAVGYHVELKKPGGGAAA